MNSTNTSSQPVLVIIRGLPGSGKSYLAHAIQGELGDAVMLVDPDAIDRESKAYLDFTKELEVQGVDAKLYPYRYLRTQAYEAITQGKVVIWNQAFTQNDMLDRTIKNLQAYAKEHQLELPALVVEVEANAALAKERVAARAALGGHDVPEEAFQRFINDYTSFAAYDHNVIQVDGGGDIAASTGAVVTEIQKLRGA